MSAPKQPADKMLPILPTVAQGVAVGNGLIILCAIVAFSGFVAIMMGFILAAAATDSYALPKFHEVMGQSGSPRDRVAPHQNKTASPKPRRK